MINIRELLGILGEFVDQTLQEAYDANDRMAQARADAYNEHFEYARDYHESVAESRRHIREEFEDNLDCLCRELLRDVDNSVERFGRRGL